MSASKAGFIGMTFGSVVFLIRRLLCWVVQQLVKAKPGFNFVLCYFPTHAIQQTVKQRLAYFNLCGVLNCGTRLPATLSSVVPA